MSNAINNLFEETTNEATVNNRSLSGTAQLTSIASNIATEVINVMNGDIETYADDLKKSQTDNNAMDALINKIWSLAETDVDFLKELDEQTIDGMLKSQQSKRSRCKAKTMTLDNYRNLMTGAIAENLIRLATGNAKSATRAHRVAGTVDYTIEELEQLSENQEQLKKEIRNIQSKKSIMKSKADFDESSEQWLALLKAEQMLKDLRVDGRSSVVEVDTTKDNLAELLADVDLEHIKAADSKELLTAIKNLLDA